MNVEAVGGQKAVSGDPLPDALGDGERAGRAGIGQDQRELVAAESGNDVGFPRAAADDRAGFDQRATAGKMSMAIVDRFEAIQIDE